MKISNEIVNIIMGENLYIINEIEGEEYTYTIGQGKIVYQGKEFKVNPEKHIFSNWMSNIQTHFKKDFYKDIASKLKVKYIRDTSRFWKEEILKLYNYFEGTINVLIDDDEIEDEDYQSLLESEIEYTSKCIRKLNDN